MKIPNGLVEQLCSHDETRERIAHCYLEITDGIGVLVATNGRACIRAKVELDDGDTAGYIPARTLELAREAKAERILCHFTNLVIVDQWHTTLNRPSQQAMGDYPKTEATMTAPAIKPPIASIALNAELLVEVQRAMGTNAVLLDVSGPTDPINIHPVSFYSDPPPVCAVIEGQVLMPVRVDDKDLDQGDKAMLPVD